MDDFEKLLRPCNSYFCEILGMNSHYDSSLKVLFVDDNITCRMVLRSFLKKCGVDFYEAENGLDAFKIYSKNSNDIGMVITDIVMPILDGVDFAKSMRALERDRKLPRIPLIFVSGYNKYDSDDLRKAGGDVFLHKPYSIGPLMDVFDLYSIHST